MIARLHPLIILTVTVVLASSGAAVCLADQVGLGGSVPDAPDEFGLVIRTIPLPTATPGDLAWDGTSLWVADWEAGELLKVHPAKGDCLVRRKAPCYRPRGLAWGDGKLYVADDFGGGVFVYDPESEVTSAIYGAPTGTGMGLAWDGEALWLAEDRDHTLQRLIPHDGTALTYFASPQRDPSGMAFDGTYLWVAQRRHDRIYMVVPKDGTVVTSFRAPGPYPCGIAPAPDGRLWVADFETGLAYLCAPREAQSYQTREWREAEVRMVYRIANDGPGDVLDAVVNFAMPRNLENQELLGELVFEPGPPVFGTDSWGQDIATFKRQVIKPGERFQVGYTAKVRMGELNYILIPEKVGSLDEIPADIRSAYTIDGQRLQVGSELVQETSQKIVGDETNPYWIARKIFNWVIEALEYERIGGWDVPETLIKRGTGSCSEYAFLFIALCRAAGLPARYEAGAMVRGDDASVDDVHHRWVEVYLPGYGWIPIDPSGGDKSTTGGQADYIGRLSNRAFITTHNGGGSEELSWTYNYHATHGRRGRCSVTEDEWVVLRREKEEGAGVTPSAAGRKP